MSKIGIIGSMDHEVKTLKANLTDAKAVTKAGMEFLEGSLNGVPVVIVQGGTGKVNGAMCAQILVDVFNVTHIITTGVAGALNYFLNIGDIVIATDTLQHDMDNTALGYNPGEVPMVGTAFAADTRMIEIAKDSCARVCPDARTVSGRVVTGDQFITDGDVKDRLVDVFHGDCTEMSGAAIAQCAYLNKVPFVMIRVISDKADGSADMNFALFQRVAAEHCVKLVMDMVKELL